MVGQLYNIECTSSDGQEVKWVIYKLYIYYSQKYYIALIYEIIIYTPITNINNNYKYHYTK